MTEKGWAICGYYGLYHGWHKNRAQAIAEHVADKMLGGWPAFALNGKLSDQQREAWGKCRRRGDRAVKIKISYGA